MFFLVFFMFPLPQKNELEDVPIELSKVQSVRVSTTSCLSFSSILTLSEGYCLPFLLKIVARKRRDRSLPRAFEIFTDSKTYVLKAQDEKHAEEWLQCINVAVAQARERENHEATTYLWCNSWDLSSMWPEPWGAAISFSSNTELAVQMLTRENSRQELVEEQRLLV